MAQYSLAYSRFVVLVGLARLPTTEKGSPIINPRGGETRQPLLANHLGEGNSELKPIVKGMFSLHCPSLLGHGSWVSCHLTIKGSNMGFQDVVFQPSLAGFFFSSTFSKIVEEAMTSGRLQVCNLWLWVCNIMLPVRHQASIILMTVNYCGSILARSHGWAAPAYHWKECATPHAGACRFSLQ